MSNNSGRFETSVKIKISTLYGTILKVIHYPVDEESYIEYKIRPKCSICGGKASCLCFTHDNFDDPLQSATDNLKAEQTCEKPQCICKTFKKMKPEEYEKLQEKYGNDYWSICEKIQEKYYIEDDDGLFCEV